VRVTSNAMVSIHVQAELAKQEELARLHAWGGEEYIKPEEPPSKSEDQGVPEVEPEVEDDFTFLERELGVRAD
jgi:hypothetical protein